MRFPHYLRHSWISWGLAVALALAMAAPSAHANVYASNVKINGGMTGVSVMQGTGVNISYILNEAASAGVAIRILSGEAAVRTIVIAPGNAGTTRGTNTVAWDGKSEGGTNVAEGVYTVSITAAALGYAGWTKITDDDNPGNYVWEARGIAVDRNTNSPYYGRVFVGNAYPGTRGQLGDQVGILKLNADGSYADEGGFSDGGIAWPGQYYAPWKIRVSEDDDVYVEDWYNAGDIYRFDGTISSGSRLQVFAPPANLSLGSFPGMCVTGRGTNTVLWTADETYPSGRGIVKYAVKPDGTFDPAAGSTVVAVGGSPGLNLSPYAVDVDKAGVIYTLQSRLNSGDSSAWVLRFPAYDPATNGGAPEYTADWVAGPGDDFCGGKGIAVDPTGTYVAAAFWGYYGATWTSGNIKIFDAATGMLVTNLDLGISYTNGLTTEPMHHMDTDADWDAVGNLYYLDDWPGCWRAFSPPGPNQATTVALATVQVAPTLPPKITRRPFNQWVLTGCTATFRGIATGTEPLSYQWQKNGTSLDGQTNGVLVLTNVQSGNFGTYRLVVTNAYGSATSSNATLTLDRVPVAGPDTIQRFAGQGVRVNASVLTANDTDPDGDILSVIGVSPSSTGGGTNSLSGNWVYYLPPAGPDSSDTFTYTVSDGHCGTAEGTVTVQIRAGGGAPVAYIENAGGGALRVSCDGIAGATYRFQQGANASSPGWQDLVTLTADVYGTCVYLDQPSAGTISRLYRILVP